MPDPPEWLDELALEEWRRVAPELEALGVVAEIDRAALVAYCCAWSTLTRAQRAIAEHGLTYHASTQAGGEMLRARPEAAQAVAAARELRCWAGELGLTPATRGRVKALRRVDPEVQRWRDL